MSAPLASLYLLADRSLFRDMGSGFRDKRENMNGTDLVLWMLAVVAVFVVIGIVAKIVARRDKRQLYNSPRGLFRQLCKAHGLERGNRALLRKLAHQQGLAQPARLFLEPDRFQAENVGAARLQEQPALDALKQRLFGANPRQPA